MSTTTFDKQDADAANQEPKTRRLAGVILRDTGPALPAVDVSARRPSEEEEQQTGFSSSLFSELGNPRAHKSLIEMPEEPVESPVRNQLPKSPARTFAAPPAVELPAFASAPEVAYRASESTSAPVADAPAQSLTCPKCQQPLIDSQGLGWCRACGYCRSLEETAAKLPAKPKPPRCSSSTFGFVEFLQLSQRMPEWAGILLFGQVMVFGCTFLLTMNLTPGTSMMRTAWCTVQVGIGLAMIFGVQVWGLAIVAADDEKLTIKDAIFSTRLWHLLWTKLPKTRWSFWLAGWGLGIIAAALLFVGGMSHWLDYLPRSSQAPPPPAAAKK